MKSIENQIAEIKNVINNNRLIADRMDELKRLGYNVEPSVPMGSGGCGQVRKMSNGTIRVQIGAAWSRNNYAPVVIINQ